MGYDYENFNEDYCKTSKIIANIITIISCSIIFTSLMLIVLT